MATKKEEKVEIKVHDGDVIESTVVLRETGAAVRMVYEYPIKDALENKYNEMLERFNVNKSNNVVVVPSPMHMNGTYLMMGTHLVQGNSRPDKFWALVRGYKSLRFNSEFVPVSGKSEFVPWCMQSVSSDKVVVPDATLQAPAGYRYVLVMLSKGALFLYGMRDSDSLLFRVPVPNMTFDSGHLCEGVGLNRRVHALVKQKAMDACAYSQLVSAWEEAQWNSDLVGTLPGSDAKKFLRWDIKGKHLADVGVWDYLAKQWPVLENSRNTDMTRNIAVATAYMKETDCVICGD